MHQQQKGNHTEPFLRLLLPSWSFAGRQGGQWTSLGGRPARQASPRLFLWAAWGSLLSITLMNSDSPGKHLFAQNVTRGGVGDWSRRPPFRQVCAFCSRSLGWVGSAAKHAGQPLWAATGHACRRGNISPVSKVTGCPWPCSGHPSGNPGTWTPGE